MKMYGGYFLIIIFVALTLTLSCVDDLLGYVLFKWHIETVDQDGGGLSTSLALDSSDYPHIAYHDETNGCLKYTRWDGTNWQIETVDSGDEVGWSVSLALDSSDYSHISYCGEGSLKYARWDGAAWQIETVDSELGVGEGNSLALDSSGYPRISYRGNESLQYAHWDGDEWQIETVDTTGNSNSGQTYLALDTSDYPHISYHGNGDVKYARWYGGTWRIESVDTTGDISTDTTMVLDSNGYPHISYRCSEELYYARRDSNGWRTETIDSGFTVEDISLALNSSDHPQIAYHFGYHDSLKYAGYDGSEWHTNYISSEGNMGLRASLALDSADCPHIAFCSDTMGNYNLMYARGE